MKNKILFLIFIFFSFSNSLYADINIYNRKRYSHNDFKMLLDKKLEEYSSNKDKYVGCYIEYSTFLGFNSGYGVHCFLKGTNNRASMFDFYFPFSSYLYDDESCISGSSNKINYPVENIINDYNGLKCINLSNNRKKNNFMCSYYQSEIINYEIYPIKEDLNGKKNYMF